MDSNPYEKGGWHPSGQVHRRHRLPGRTRPRALRGLGSLDLYGDGRTTEDPQLVRKVSGELKSNRSLLLQRVNAALEQLRRDSRVDGHQLAAIGYCFGGTTVLELARSGAEVRGVVAFHPGLDSPNPSDGRNIKAVCSFVTARTTL